MAEKKTKQSKFMQRCVADVVAQGKETGSAFAICTAQAQKAGYAEPGSRKLTGKGKKREKQFSRQKDMPEKRKAYMAATGREEGVRAILRRLEESEKRLTGDARELDSMIHDDEVDVPDWLRTATVVSAKSQMQPRRDPQEEEGSVERMRAVVRDEDGVEHQLVVDIWGTEEGAGVKVVSDRRQGKIGEEAEGVEVAKEILHQLGGNRFTAMTGAKHFVSTDKISDEYPFPGLAFQLPIGKYKAIRIGLNPATDTYVVQFLNRSMRVTHEMPDVYADNLQHVIGQETGLALGLQGGNREEG